MSRAELEGLDRDSLVARAEAAGVVRARTLTRPELVDELLMRAHGRTTPSARRARGFFGLARDLLASVVERGLHLPDAADRIRSFGGEDEPMREVPAPAALPTMTLAEIYASQGHRKRAIETLEQVLEREPDHAAARTLYEHLTHDDYVPPREPLPPEPEQFEEPPDDDDAPPVEDQGSPAAVDPAAAAAALDLELLSFLGQDGAPAAAPAASPPPAPREPAAPEVRVAESADAPEPSPPDMCVALPVSDGAWDVRYSVAPETLVFLAERHELSALVLRTVIVRASWEGPLREVRDVPLEGPAGEMRLEAEGISVLRVSVGAIVDGAFTSIAHAAWIERRAAGGHERVQWTARGFARAPVDELQAP